MSHARRAHLSPKACIHIRHAGTCGCTPTDSSALLRKGNSKRVTADWLSTLPTCTVSSSVPLTCTHERTHKDTHKDTCKDTLPTCTVSSSVPLIWSQVGLG